MLGLTILISRANAIPDFFRPRTTPPCALAAAAPSKGWRHRRPETLRLMTAAFKPPSSQEGFFWKTKTLEEMSNVEWESLCDGCARCCLEKLEDEDTGKIYFTHVSCKLLDAGLCACKDYKNRSDQVPDCVRLTPENVRTLNWLPPSCGYKLVAEGRDLYWWHPLISGDPNTVHEAGVSVRGRVQGTENEIADADLEDHIVQWPALLPKRARLKKRPQS
jgi:uncharacterized cysteine cluster protein YcgN (CxxCxxCC family)